MLFIPKIIKVLKFMITAFFCGFILIYSSEKNVKINSFLIAEINQMGSALYIMVYNKYDYPPFDYIDYSSPDVEDIINNDCVKEFIRLLSEMQKRHIKAITYMRDDSKIKIIYEDGDIIEWFFYRNKNPTYFKR